MQNSNSDKPRIYFPTLDGLRFFAFLLVFVHHSLMFPSTLGTFFHNWGWIGVELFFILSSFLLTKLLIVEFEKNNAIAILKYFIRRILRIWPLYFAFIIFSIMLFFIFSHGSASNYLFRILGLVTFTDNIITAVTDYNQLPFISHFWTISFEEQFYIILPFVIPFFVSLKKFKVYLIIFFAWIIFLALRSFSVYKSIPHPFIWTMIFQGDALLVGMILAVLKPLQLKKTTNFLFILIGGIILSGLIFIPPVHILGYHQIYAYSVISIGLGLIVFGIMQSENKILNFCLGNKGIRYLGKISYGLYIFHIFSIWIIQKLCVQLKIDNLYFIFSVSLIITVLLSIFSYELFEKRFLRLKEKFSIVKSRPI